MMDHNSTGLPAGQPASVPPMSLAAVVAAVSPYAPVGGPIEEYPRGGFTPERERRGYLEAALSGVEFGSYDRRILDWAAQWDDTTVRVLVSLIVRARLASHVEAPAPALDDADVKAVIDALDVAADCKRDLVSICGECEVCPEGLCPTCESRLDAVEGYERVSRELTGGAP